MKKPKTRKGTPQKAVRKRKGARRRWPHARIARLWRAGKTIAQIAKAIGRIEKRPDPFHAMRNCLRTMHQQGYRDEKGNTVKLPYRADRKAVKATKGGHHIPAES
jgi:hypothetical protein